MDYTRIKVPTAPPTEVTIGEEEDDFLKEIKQKESEEKLKNSGVVPLSDHNFRVESNTLMLKLRPHDYRILSFTTD